jgi:hypothetical protein
VRGRFNYFISMQRVPSQSKPLVHPGLVVGQGEERLQVAPSSPFSVTEPAEGGDILLFPSFFWLFILASTFLILLTPSFLIYFELPVGRAQWHHSPSLSSPFPRVALIVNCAQRHLVEWENVLSALPIATRANLSLFFAVYGTEAPVGVEETSSPFSLAHLFQNASRLAPAVLVHTAPCDPRGSKSWTLGRNDLLKHVYSHEVLRAEQFTYWVIADGDTSHVDCVVCLPSTRPPDYTSAACCLDKFLGALLTSDEFGFSTVGQTLTPDEFKAMPPPQPGGRTSFLFRDCTDGQMQAFHRDAVPVALPYHEEFENITWLASQSMLFMYTSSCLRGSSAVIGAHLQVWDNEHGQDYGGIDLEGQIRVFATLHPDIFGRVLNPQRQCQAPGWIFPPSDNVSDAIITIEGGGSKGVTASGYPVNPRLRWNETCAFQACRASLYPRFIELLGGGVQEAPRREGMGVGWVWGWQALSQQPPPWWTNDTSMVGLSTECNGVIA